MTFRKRDMKYPPLTPVFPHCALHWLQPGELMWRNNCNHKIFPPAGTAVFMQNFPHECWHPPPQTQTESAYKLVIPLSLMSAQKYPQKCRLPLLCDIGACDVVWTYISNILLHQRRSPHFSMFVLALLPATNNFCFISKTARYWERGDNNRW